MRPVLITPVLSFSLVTLFGPSPRPAWFVLQLPVIDVPLNTAALVIAIAAFALIFYFKRGMMVTLAVCAALGLAFHLAS